MEKEQGRGAHNFPDLMHAGEARTSIPSLLRNRSTSFNSCPREKTRAIVGKDEFDLIRIWNSARPLSRREGGSTGVGCCLLSFCLAESFAFPLTA